MARTGRGFPVWAVAIAVALVAACILALVGAATGASAATSPVTTLVSVSSSGQQADADSYGPSISADGRYVAFVSKADNLDPSGHGAFVRDRSAGTTRLASGPLNAYQPPSISGDGRFVAFSDYNNVYVDDLSTGKAAPVSVDAGGNLAGGGSASPSISADGRYIAFSSYARNLTRQKPNRLRNEFVRDMKTGKTEQVNVNSAGKPGNGSCHHPSISASGRYVAFESNATNLVKGAKGWNIYVRDLRKHRTRLASLSSAGKRANGKSANPAISGDGRYVAFESRATNLVKHDTNKTYDVFRRDLRAQKTTRVSVSSSGKQANDASRFPTISNHGGFIAFESAATNLVNGDTDRSVDAFYRDDRGRKTVRVNVSSSGEQANVGSGYGSAPPSISADGRFVAFESPATNLVPGDTNGLQDAFVRGPLHG